MRVSATKGHIPQWHILRLDPPLDSGMNEPEKKKDHNKPS